jgi:hypothetical protein
MIGSRKKIKMQALPCNPLIRKCFRLEVGGKTFGCWRPEVRGLRQNILMFIASNLKRSAPPTSYMVVGPPTLSEAVL